MVLSVALKKEIFNLIFFLPLKKFKFKIAWSWILIIIDL
jgi:hypothetical protein